MRVYQVIAYPNDIQKNAGVVGIAHSFEEAKLKAATHSKEPNGYLGAWLVLDEFTFTARFGVGQYTIVIYNETDGAQ